MAAAHFPIGLLLSSAFFEVIGALRKKQGWREAAYWNHLLGVVSTIVVVTLGWFGNPYKTGEAAAKVAVHQYYGFAGLAIFTFLALWRWRMRNKWTRKTWPVYLLLTFIGAIVIGITGYLGSRILD